MSFQDDVRNARDAVLKEPKYKVPIDFLNERVERYQTEKIQEQTQTRENDTEIER